MSWAQWPSTCHLRTLWYNILFRQQAPIWEFCFHPLTFLDFFQATIKLTGSRDALHLNNSNERWYDSNDDYDHFHDSTVPVSKDVLPDKYIQPKPQSMSVPRASHKDRSNYSRAERYSPTEPLFKPRTLDYEMMAPSHGQVTDAAKPHHHAHSNSNLSELSVATHSTHSSGSGQKDTGVDSRSSHGSIKRQSPRNAPDVHGKRSPSPTTPVGATSKDYAFHRRTGPSASSSSSMSDSSPKFGRRYVHLWGLIWLPIGYIWEGEGSMDYIWEGMGRGNSNIIKASQYLLKDHWST